MIKLDRSLLQTFGLSLTMGLAACSGDDGANDDDANDDDDHDHEDDEDHEDESSTSNGSSTSSGSMSTTGEDTGETGDETGEPPEAAGQAWYFGQDNENNRWIVTLVDPTHSPVIVETFDVTDLADLSGPAPGNEAGPGWGDAEPSTDGHRVFINATSVDKVAVFEIETHSLEAILDVGPRPVHLWNPNHGDEIWTHADGPGSFYVIDQGTLAVSDPVVAATDAGGHGKLLYAEELGEQYFATQVNAPGGYPIDGAARSVGDIIALCGAPCEDDPMTPEDESEQTCGGTHDKGYNPRMNYAIFQCSGASGGHYAFVDASDNTVVQDLVEIDGGIAHSAGNEYTLVIGETTVNIWDTTADDHDGIAFDASVEIAGEPSARGTDFRENGDGEWEAWIPQSAGTKLVVLNLATNDTEEIEIGTATPPAGQAHATRRGIIGGQWFFTYNDDGVVIVDLDSHDVMSGGGGINVGGLTQRIAFVPPHSH